MNEQYDLRTTTGLTNLLRRTRKGWPTNPNKRAKLLSNIQKERAHIHKQLSQSKTIIGSSKPKHS